MGRHRHQWSPPGPPHLAWLSCMLTSEKSDGEMTLSVLPCSFKQLCSPGNVRVFECDAYSSAVSEVSEQGCPLKSIQRNLVYLVGAILPFYQDGFKKKSQSSSLKALFCSFLIYQLLSQPPWLQAETCGGKLNNTNKNLSS